jgi:predicted GIY-YIG superfamily endonuclease
MLLRDRLLARLATEGGLPDYVRLAGEVLGIRNAPPALARTLVEQALVMEDRREAWLRLGDRIASAAPASPGVYVLRDSDGRALYVGKANNLRRRLRTHFAARRWRAVKAEFARAAGAEWHAVGSEIEALLREARLIRELSPVVNVQVSAPALDTRGIPAALLRDVLVVVPSARAEEVEILGARPEGAVLLRAAARDGRGLASRVREMRGFFELPAHEPRGPSSAAPVQHAGASFDGFAPLVYSWLSGRGASATRLDPHDAPSARELERRLAAVLRDRDLFAGRIVVIRSGFRSTSTRP